MPGLEVTPQPPASKPEDFTLPSEFLGLGRLGTKADPAGSRDLIADLLHQNHEKYHMYFRDVAGHNHIPHAVLTTLAMGGGPKQLRRAYDDGEGIQRPKTQPDPKVVDEIKDRFKFLDRMQDIEEYSNFLAFFEQEIAAKGWQAVISETILARHPQSDFLLAQVFEGLYHPLIHMGFGVEFELPGLVAEGLAQAASHDPMYIDVYFQRTERLAQKGTIAPQPLAEIYRLVRANEAVRTAARLPDGPWKVRDGVLGRTMEEIIQLGARVQVKPTEEDVERATAEMISCAAWTCGGCSRKPGKEAKIDFFLMHNLTASLMLTVLCRQPWIKIEDKARMVEYKSRLDLVWYAASAAPEIVHENLQKYEPKASKGWDWRELYEAVNLHHDDGHVAKFVRACKNGEEVCAPYEGEESFPVKGGEWLKLAQMCYDSTHMFVDGQKKWVWGAGFDAMWKDVKDVE